MQIGKRRVHVTARPTDGDERAALWSAMIDGQHVFDDYAANTDWEIPVLVLTPTGDHGTRCSRAVLAQLWRPLRD